MAYTKQTWTNDIETFTPVTAARLNHMEDGIYNAHDLATGLQLKTVSFSPNTSLMNYSSYGSASLYNDDWITLQFMIALSDATNWSSNNLRLGTVNTVAARPSGDRTVYRACMLVNSTGLVSMRTLKYNADGTVTVNAGSPGTAPNVVLAIVQVVTLRL